MPSVTSGKGLRFVVATACVVVLAWTGCTSPPRPTGNFLHFETEGKRFELRHIVLTHLPLGGGERKFVDLGFDPAEVEISSAAPAATIQWKMDFTAMTELEGRVIDLSREDHSAVVQFILEEPGSGLVHETERPSFRLNLRRVADGFVEGTFEGEGFSRVAGGKVVARGLGVSGSFRARLEEVSW